MMLGPGLVLWCFLWLFTTAETPKKHRRITTREREYIEHCLADKGLKEGVRTNRYLQKISKIYPQHKPFVKHLIPCSWGGTLAITDQELLPVPD